MHAYNRQPGTGPNALACTPSLLPGPVGRLQSQPASRPMHVLLSGNSLEAWGWAAGAGGCKVQAGEEAGATSASRANPWQSSFVPLLQPSQHRRCTCKPHLGGAGGGLRGTGFPTVKLASARISALVEVMGCAVGSHT